MRCSFRPLVFVILAVSVISQAVFAETILSVSGPNYGPGALGGSSFQILGSAWSTSASYADVTISSNLSGSPSSLPGTAFLMSRIGPGTTTTSEIARTAFQAGGPDVSTTLFNGLSMPAGTYYLVLSSSSAASDLGWWSAFNPMIETAPGTQRLGDVVAGLNRAIGPADFMYPPASVFDGPFPVQSFPNKLNVTGSEVPEPTIGILVPIGILGLFVLRRILRKSAASTAEFQQ